jgi:hypothetical protein
MAADYRAAENTPRSHYIHNWRNRDRKRQADSINTIVFL